MVSVFWSRSSWDFGFGILPRQSPRALGLYELYPRTFSSFLVLMLHAHDFLTVKKRLLACLLVSWPGIMSTKREKLFALKSLSWSSCWQLLSAAPLLNPVYWNPPGAFWLVIQDNTWLLSFCVFFFPSPRFISAQRKAGSLGSTIIRGSASCDWLTYMPYWLRAIFKRDSIAMESFSIELVTDFHLVTSK